MRLRFLIRRGQMARGDFFIWPSDWWKRQHIALLWLGRGTAAHPVGADRRAGGWLPQHREPPYAPLWDCQDTYRFGDGSYAILSAPRYR